MIASPPAKRRGISSVAVHLIEQLSGWGVDVVFAVPGAQVDPILEALADDCRIRLIFAAHEQGAAYMADGYARNTQRPAAVVCLGGPGATNLVTAAVTARALRTGGF